MQPVIRDNQYIIVDKVRRGDIPCTVRLSPYHTHVIENGVFIEWVLDSELYNEHIREQRQARYKEETDPLKLEIEFDAMSTDLEVDYSTWITAVEQIKLDLPYI